MDGYLVTLASLDNMKGDQCVIMICNHFFFFTAVGNVFRVVSEKDIFTNPHWTSPRLLETGGLFQPSSCHAEALLFVLTVKIFL